MKENISVPSMGESVTTAKVAQILKKTGTFLHVDEEILELETDKVNQVLYSPLDGQLTLLVKEGDTVKIGDVIGYVESVKEKQAEVASAEVVSKESGSRKNVTEFVKELKNTNEEKPIKKEILHGNEVRKKLSSLRQTIAKKLVEVKNETAMLTTFNEVDLSEVLRIREEFQEKFQKKYGVKLGFMAFFVKAIDYAVKFVPEVVTLLEGDELVTKNSLDISIAVSTEKGLMTPVLRNTEQLTFAEVELEIMRLAELARKSKITLDELTGGSFTITNGGVFGSLLSTPIINPPQSAILGMHKIQKRAVVIEDRIEIRPMMYLALSYDHRVIDGKEAVTFLVHVKEALEEPSRLLLEV